MLADKIKQLKSVFFLQKEDNSWKYLSQLLLTSYFILVCLNEKYWLLLLVFLHDDDTCTVNCYFTLPVHHICTLGWLVRPTFSVFNCIHSDYGMKLPNFLGGNNFSDFLILVFTEVLNALNLLIVVGVILNHSSSFYNE